MKLLLDEDVPAPATELIKRLAQPHEVHHVAGLRWNGKKDLDVLKDARRNQFDAILTNDLKQLSDPEECQAIHRSGLHHIRYEIKDGLSGLGLATGAICAAIRPLLEELGGVSSQRLVRITGLSHSTHRYELTDPTQDPPPYWPR